MTTIKFKRLNIEAYKPGKSSIKKLKNITKLSANESALGVSTRVKKIISNKNLNLFRYPDGKSKELRNQISKKFRCNKEKIICGAGSDEVIQMLCQLFLKPKDEAIVPQFSFLMYRIYAKIVGAKIIFSKEKNFKISLDDIVAKTSNRTKIVFLANPNNPTGTYLNINELKNLRKRLNKKILLVIDDAYFEYMTQKDYASGLRLFKNSKNVFILRTFSKVYGLASLRVGWGYGPKKIIDELYKIKPPFNVNKIAQLSAIESLKDSEFIKKSVKHNLNWSIKIKKFLKINNINTNKISANFFLLDFDNCKRSAKYVEKKLEKKRIILRSMKSYKMKNKLRMTIGSSIENKKFIKEMNNIFR